MCWTVLNTDSRSADNDGRATDNASTTNTTRCHGSVGAFLPSFEIHRNEQAPRLCPHPVRHSRGACFITVNFKRRKERTYGAMTTFCVCRACIIRRPTVIIRRPTVGVQHSPAQSSTVHHNPPRSGTVQHSQPESTTVRHSPAQSSTVQHSPAQSTTIHHGPAQSSTIQHSPAQSSTPPHRMHVVAPSSSSASR